MRFPFEGGRLQQPSWALHNLDTLALLDEYHDLRARLKAAKRAPARRDDDWNDDAPPNEPPELGVVKGASTRFFPNGG